jgi:hypothetical protein
VDDEIDAPLRRRSTVSDIDIDNIQAKCAVDGLLGNFA